VFLGKVSDQVPLSTRSGFFKKSETLMVARSSSSSGMMVMPMEIAAGASSTKTVVSSTSIAAGIESSDFVIAEASGN
jgi:hypothetical protein